MDPNRKHWNERHQLLTRALAAGDRDRAVELFLDQHAMVHSAKLVRSGLWSFEDEILNGLTGSQFRAIPPGGEHSIAWIMLHLTRIEDITMNLLVAGTPQLFTRGGWNKKMKTGIVHSANKMEGANVAALSARMDLATLQAYRLAVGRRTREIVKTLRAEDFKKKVEPARIQKVRDEGAVLPEAMEIVEYWSKKTIAGLLLMPPTRHCILHWNEAAKIKQRLLR